MTVKDFTKTFEKKKESNNQKKVDDKSLKKARELHETLCDEFDQTIKKIQRVK